MFDKSHKKLLPRYPQKIAVITSSAGAAVKDIIRVLGKRYPVAKVIVLPVRVQGVEAPAEIVGALKYANKYKIADLIIVGRGGGSIEDLWAFNDERVARAIYASEIPVISAVGHEPDVTIADFVADLRAATPSNGAELAVPDISDVADYLESLNTRMTKAVKHRLDESRIKLSDLSGRRVMQSPMNYIDDKKILLDYTRNRLLSAEKALIAESHQRFVKLSAFLDAMSPLKVLGRGYSIAATAEGVLIKDAKQVTSGDKIKIKLQKDEINCTVD